MNKIKSFVRLDFVTVKPYFTIKNLLIYVAIAVYMAIMSKNISSSIGVGMMLATMFVSYPFTLAEKNNMDALYVTLGVDRKTVVKGRYVFALLLNLCAVVFVSAFSLTALGFINSLGNVEELWGTLGATLALSAVFLVVQATQIPMYFKLGYTKAKFMSILPFFMIMAFVGYLVMSGQQGDGMPDWAITFFQNLVEDLWAIGVVAVAFLAAVVFVSYKLSLAFYRKREF
jgi:hypothetical protein